MSDDISVLELFHDIMALRMLVSDLLRVLSHFTLLKVKIVLVATSGDTGAAVASGFHKVKGINVFILLKSGLKVQEKQITSVSDNIYLVEVDGSFDDCQRIVKKLRLIIIYDLNLTSQLQTQLIYQDGYSDIILFFCLQTVK